jgi:hypothetical protein
MIKKLLFCICVMMVALAVKSQVYVDGKNVSADTTVHYLEIIYIADPGSFDIDWVDAGNKKYLRLTDSAGKKIGFDSPTRMLHHMQKNGWNIIRRDMVYRSGSEARFNNRTLAFALFERANTAPAH